MIRPISFLSFLLMPVVIAGSLKVEVSGVKSHLGKVRCLLFSQADGYPDTVSKAVGKAILPAVQAKDGQLILSIDGLKEDSYAVIVHHDEDGSGKVEKNFLGIPKEPIAISNWNGKSRPRFQKNIVFLSHKKPLKLTLK